MDKFNQYVQTVEVVRDFLSGKGSLKNLCYANHIENKKAVIALVHQTLKFKRVLVEVLSMAQIPGFKYSDLKRYERLVSGEKLVDVKDEEDEDVKYELEQLQWKRNRTASFHSKSNNKADDNDDESLGDIDAEDDNLGLSLTWHSCFVSVSVPQYKLRTSGVQKENVEKKDDKRDQKKKRKREEDVVEAFRTKYLRETMLVLAYDMLFGKGLPRFTVTAKDVGKKDKVGVFGAMKLLTSKVYNLFTEDEEMRRNGDNEQSEGVKLKYVADTKPKWMQNNSGIDLSSLLKPKEKPKSLWGSSSATKPVIAAVEQKKEVIPAKLQHEKEDRLLVKFYSLGFVPPADWSVKKRLTSAFQVLRSRDMPTGSEDQDDQLCDELRSVGKRLFPRFVRVNTLLATGQEVTRKLVADGYTMQEKVPEQFYLPEQTKLIGYNSKNQFNRHDTTQYGGSLDDQYTTLRTSGAGFITNEKSEVDVEQEAEKVFWIDPFVPNQLCFMPNNLEILGHTMVSETRELVVQDKASCLTPLAQLPVKGAQVIDGCSAPGNKTSLLAALLHNEGRVYAIELNARRAASMKTRLEDQGASCVNVLNTSFFNIDPKDSRFVNTEYIMLDPSCSGSGAPSADVQLANDGAIHTEDSGHVRSLADLQTNLLKHAQKFPKVHTIAYSTCSVYDRENEEVVARILPEMEKNGFHLVPALPRWPCRGQVSDKLPLGHYTCRVNRDVYHTGGFFVALFTKAPASTSAIQQLQETVQQYNKLE